MSKPLPAVLKFDKTANTLCCIGVWSVTYVAALQHLFKQCLSELPKEITVSGKELTYFDSAAAVALHKMLLILKEKGIAFYLVDFEPHYLALYELIAKKNEILAYEPEPPAQKNIFYRIGEEAVHKITQADGLIVLVGDLSLKIGEALGNLKRFRFTSIMANIEKAGLQALPIVALLSFLIGVVLAYQMGLQLQTYGASIFISYLSGMAIFREFGPLITAIIIAGRTSSAFTAELGSMKINEEIDALETMGLSPTELLVMPKVLGLLLIFPLLIFWSDCFSILGAMYMSKNMLDVGYYDFLLRLKDSVGLDQLLLGLYKAPAFALLIAVVGCFQGFQVESNADSIGTQTTKSVVQALFLIIVADAIYSVVYSWMNL